MEPSEQSSEPTQSTQNSDQPVQNSVYNTASSPHDNHHLDIPPTKKHNRSNRLLGIVFAILIIAFVGLAGWLIYRHFYNKSTVLYTSTSTSKNTSSNLGFVFFDSPIKLNNLNFFKSTDLLFGTICSSMSQTNCPPTVPIGDISYYQIGTSPQNQPIIVAADYNAGESSFSYVALEDKTNHYEIIGSDNNGLSATVAADTTTITNLKNSLNSVVSYNGTYGIPNLNFPQSATVNGFTVTLPAYSGLPGYFINGLSGIRGPTFATSPVKSSDITKIGVDGSVTFYEVTAETNADYLVREVYGAIGGVYAASYMPVDPLSSSTAPEINWDNGSTLNVNTYTDAASGCGSANGYVVTNNLDSSQLISAGIGPNGETIYQLPITSVLFKDYYSEYGTGSNLQNSSLANLSSNAFQQDFAVIVAKNALGENVVYERADMASVGGCGKPVIYLYPTTKTKVNIKVGADITASDPTYTANGWTNIIANPNGNLVYRGKNYNSLYWEGTGIGVYPEINSGIVVAHDQVVATISKQLSEQGLKPNEIKDFLTFWEAKLPTTPFVRLTWLNTQQMNRLAPLQISPHPNTLIRVFLDSEGLDKPVKLTPQVFKTPLRTGFTVVEWGGLLLNN